MEEEQEPPLEEQGETGGGQEQQITAPTGGRPCKCSDQLIDSTLLREEGGREDGVRGGRDGG